MKILWEEYGGNVPDDFELLLKLPGVGRKSANLIMGDVFGKPAIVTDTHCIRLVNRMGLVDQIKEPKKVEMELWKIIPPEKEAISVTGWFIMGEKSAQPGPSHSATGAVWRISAGKSAYRRKRRRRNRDRREKCIEGLQGEGNARFFNGAVSAGLRQRAGGSVLSRRDPYTSCGMLAVNVDDFKRINERYGRGSGDRVLIGLAGFLLDCVRENGVVIRAEGDEFLIFIKSIPHQEMIRRMVLFMEGIRSLKFAGVKEPVTCSIGVCFLPENIPGYSCEYMEENARWALSRAKRKGKNQFVFCDFLRQGGTTETQNRKERKREIEPRYFQGSVVSVAFQIFEEAGSFQEAMELLLEVVGFRYQLDGSR